MYIKKIDSNDQVWSNAQRKKTLHTFVQQYCDEICDKKFTFDSDIFEEQVRDIRMINPA